MVIIHFKSLVDTLRLSEVPSLINENSSSMVQVHIFSLTLSYYLAGAKQGSTVFLISCTIISHLMIHRQNDTTTGRNFLLS